jgi:prophage tail gpP-like protein
VAEQVSLTISGKKFTFWSEVTFTRSIDNHPTVAFLAPFEPERAVFRELFRPFSYAPVKLHIADELLFTGTMIDVNPQMSAALRMVDVTAYSRAAKLSECDMPWGDPPAVPFECNGLKLDAIAKHFCAPFGLDAKVEGDSGDAFFRVKPTKRTKKRNKIYGGAGQETLQVEGNVQDFLAELGRQRGFVLSSNEDGDLLFRSSTPTGAPVVSLVEGEQPLLSVVPQFNPREFYSEITGVTPAKNKRKGSSYTLMNPFLTQERRSMSFNLDDTEAADAPLAVRAKLGRMFANVMSVSVAVPTWRDPRGGLWAPNTTVTLLAPSAMIYRKTEFLVRDVMLTQTAATEMAELNLVLPGAFSGEIPDALPWLE